MPYRKKNLLTIVSVITLLFNLLVPSFAQDGDRPPVDVGAQGAYGQITALSDNSISILPRHVGETRTFSITPDTSIFINKKSATLDKLKVGSLAVVASDDGLTTSVVNEYVPRRGNGIWVLLIIPAIALVVGAIEGAQFKHNEQSIPKYPTTPPFPVPY